MKNLYIDTYYFLLFKILFIGIFGLYTKNLFYFCVCD